MDHITVWVSFGGGVLAFISPCTLPLYPSFLSYIAGVSVNDLQFRSKSGISKTVLLHSIFFLAGFSLIYYLLGFSASLLGHWFEQYKDLIRMLGGVFIFLLGCFLLGVFRPRILMREFRFSNSIKGIDSKFGSAIAGVVFAAGWTPCIGPIFGAIMYTNIINPGPLTTFLKVTAYALGFGIPFIVMGYFIGKIKWMLKYSEPLMKVGGVVLMLLGVMLYFDKVSWLNTWAL